VSLSYSNPRDDAKSTREQKSPFGGLEILSRAYRASSSGEGENGIRAGGLDDVQSVQVSNLCFGSVTLDATELDQRFRYVTI